MRSLLLLCLLLGVVASARETVSCPCRTVSLELVRVPVLTQCSDYGYTVSTADGPIAVFSYSACQFFHALCVTGCAPGNDTCTNLCHTRFQECAARFFAKCDPLYTQCIDGQFPEPTCAAQREICLNAPL